MGSFRVWLFRILVLVVAGLMLVSWFMPWWAADVLELRESAREVVIRPWGLEVFEMPEFAWAVAGSEMPVWFAPAMWTYLGLCIAALLFASWIKDRDVRLLRKNFNLPKFVIGLVGFSYIVVAVLAVIVAAIQTGEFYNVKLIGKSIAALSEWEESGIEAGLLFGYWLACGVGPLLIVLALFRNKIIGKAKLIT